MHMTTTRIFLAGCLMSAGAAISLAQTSPVRVPATRPTAPRVAQIVALDECDPSTFDALLGPDFCRNVALGASTTLSDLFAKAAGGDPDPGWDFEPDVLKIDQGTDLSVVDQGGEPHTFTEVDHFGGGFIGRRGEVLLIGVRCAQITDALKCR